MFKFFKNCKSEPASEFENEVEDFIEISTELMDASFDRSAGRYCRACGLHGSHHTDQHNHFAQAAIAGAQDDL